MDLQRVEHDSRLDSRFPRMNIHVAFFLSPEAVLLIHKEHIDSETGI